MGQENSRSDIAFIFFFFIFIFFKFDNSNLRRVVFCCWLFFDILFILSSFFFLTQTSEQNVTISTSTVRLSLDIHWYCHKTPISKTQIIMHTNAYIARRTENCMNIKINRKIKIKLKLNWIQNTIKSKPKNNKDENTKLFWEFNLKWDFMCFPVFSGLRLSLELFAKIFEIWFRFWKTRSVPVARVRSSVSCWNTK